MDTLFGPPPATLQLLLDDPAEHDFPCAERLLSGLTPQQAVTVPPGLSHSIAAILAHMHANVAFNLGLIGSADPLSFQPPENPWPSVSAEEWPHLAQAFLADLARLGQVGQDAQELARTLYPATADEPGWTVGYKLAASVAKHNAYHFGQIALIRQLIGA
ncbi:DinB family protein [Deinococcus sp. AJ005]|uniref:DinB family protein n=1 Tax=Deinococcus sp. AJ005 TaxID=2652443 RepID=UPI0018656E52|nr:DinB family protein [Deinococcus sp. AJ005]